MYNYQLQILLSELGFFTDLKTKKIKFNPKPLKQKKQKTEIETPTEIPSFIDLHLDTTSKIDELIKKHEQQNINKEEPIEKTTLTQIREPWSKTPKKSLFQPETIQTTFEKNDSLFELEGGPSFNQNIQTNNPTPLSNQVTFFNEPLTNKNINSVEKIDNNQDLLAGLGIRINRNPNQTTTQKTKESTIAKTDLDKARQELERKKQELEEMQRLAKEKEEELKKKEEEEKKLERLNKIKQKELEKENRIKEKQQRLEQIRQEKEQRILEKQRQIELEKQEKEKRIIEKQLQIESEKQEKLKKIEEEKLIRERELKKMLKEQEEKEKLLAKQQKIEEITYKKARLKEEQQSLQAEQEKLEEKMKEPEKKLGFKINIKTQKPEKTNKPELTNINISHEEVGQALKIVDNLLEKLPEAVIIEFIKSKDYEIYERVLSKYNKK